MKEGLWIMKGKRARRGEVWGKTWGDGRKETWRDGLGGRGDIETEEGKEMIEKGKARGGDGIGR